MVHLVPAMRWTNLNASQWARAVYSAAAGDTFKLRGTPKACQTNPLPKGFGGPVNSLRDIVTVDRILQWAIRSQAPNPVQGMEKVQRLDGGGCEP